MSSPGTRLARFSSVSSLNPTDVPPTGLSVGTPAPDTAGKPADGTEIRILDEASNEVPTGETGRIFVRSGTLFDGYTSGTTKDFHEGFMSSGDVGYLDADGRLFVVGRDDEMIVSGGENVFPQEVEDCLSRHEAVVEVAAIGVDDAQFGKRLRAFVVVGPGGPSEDDLKDWVRQNLAGYKTPREVVFIDELPRNSTGKVLKRELAERDDDSESQPVSHR